MSLFHPVINVFNQAGIDYVVVGELAALAHGVNRCTAVVEFVIELERKNAEEAIRQIMALGLKPKVSVDPMLFADEKQRSVWIKEKNMKVFSFYHPENSFLIIDFFVEYPIDFKSLHARSIIKQLGTIPVRVCGKDDLNAIKKENERAMENVRLEHALHIAKSTTWAQRFHWLETTIEALRPQLLENYLNQAKSALIYPGSSIAGI